MDYDVVIVGAGPAGLAAASRFAQSDGRFLLVEAGGSLPERDNGLEEDLTQGCGGAGLYSDGKFSFHPSASALWRLPHQAELADAYHWTQALLDRYGLSTPSLSSHAGVSSEGTDTWILKEYKPEYISLASRKQMIAELSSCLKEGMQTTSSVTSYAYDANSGSFHVHLLHADGTRRTVSARQVIVATGRFGPTDVGMDSCSTFRRLEVGFRIEQPSSKAFFSSIPLLDPNILYRDAERGIEWRTFCACRNGRTVHTRTLGLWTVSGHSDGPKTTSSNIGFNTRILDQFLFCEIFDGLIANLKSEDSYYRLSAIDALKVGTIERARLDHVYGEPLSGIMLDGLKRLMDEYPAIVDSDTRLVGPTLEGIGWYPQLDGSLRIPDRPLRVAGDATGLFRGIVAAFVSGHYAASLALTELEKKP